MEDRIADAVRRLAARHPTVERVTIALAFTQAVETVASMIGHLDLDMAEDLTELRLQIRKGAGLTA